MNSVQFLSVPTAAPDLLVEHLIVTYLTAKRSIEPLVAVQTEAKRRLQTIIEETGQDEWITHSGKLIVPAASCVVSYDAQALDSLAAANKTLRRLITPFRSESLRQGGIRITGK